MPSPGLFKKVLPVYLMWRIISLFLYLFHALTISVPNHCKTKNKRVDCVLVQNPPAMPLLFVVWVYLSCVSFFTGYRPAFVIDWHNLGFTMLSNSPILSKIARLYEQIMAPKADVHLCVTSAIKMFIEKEFGIGNEAIYVVHDCPPIMFRSQTMKNNHELLTKIHGKLCANCPRSWYQHLDPSRQTLFTEKILNSSNDDIDKYSPRINRPALVTSSTSWTCDEDFSILLKALARLDGTISESHSSLKVLVVVTGKGPQKGFYLKEIAGMKLNNVAIQTIWLEPADYPRLIACADLAVSLHTSTSGIDLPMKILDNFGCEVPVCAYNFPCLPELVKDNVNGRIFENSSELYEQLLVLLSPLDAYPGSWPFHGFADLAKYSKSLRGRKRWDENWKENALPAIEAAVSR